MAVDIPPTTAKPKAQSPRKQARKERTRQTFFEDVSITTPSPSTSPSTTPSPQPSTLHLPPQHHLAMAPQFRLLICSIGNPAPYLGTLHSAGHTVLAALATYLSAAPFTRSRAHASGLVARTPDDRFTLWQSPTLMNVSGPAVASAWRAFLRNQGCNGQAHGQGSDGAVPRLVVLHDELEAPLGTVVVRKGSASAKGHNGLRSIQGVLGREEGEWTRIGVGIGRPASREAEVVSAYVLRKMSGLERNKIEGVVGRVVEELERLSGGA